MHKELRSIGQWRQVIDDMLILLRFLYYTSTKLLELGQVLLKTSPMHTPRIPNPRSHPKRSRRKAF